MSTTAFTLDDIRAATEEKFGSFDIELPGGELKLRNPLRMSKEERAEFSRLQKALRPAEPKKDDEGQEVEVELTEEQEVAQETEQIDKIRAILTCVAESSTLAKELINVLGDDLGQTATVFRLYSEKVQAGEA